MRTEPEGFPEFWLIWKPYARHTDGRGLAREAFAKHVKAGACPQDIVDGAKYFFRTMKDKDRDYVPLSATWMNRGSYEDSAEAERVLQQKLRERAVAQPNVIALQQPKESPERRAEMAARLRQVASGMRSS